MGQNPHVWVGQVGVGFGPNEKSLSQERSTSGKDPARVGVGREINTCEVDRTRQRKVWAPRNPLPPKLGRRRHRSKAQHFHVNIWADNSPKSPPFQFLWTLPNQGNLFQFFLINIIIIYPILGFCSVSSYISFFLFYYSYIYS